MATRDDLSVDGDDGDYEIPSKDGETQPDSAKAPKRLKKGWKDPTDILARGKFKTSGGNIREDF